MLVGRVHRGSMCLGRLLMSGVYGLRARVYVGSLGCDEYKVEWAVRSLDSQLHEFNQTTRNELVHVGIFSLGLFYQRE